MHDLCKANIYKPVLRKCNETRGMWEAFNTYAIEDKFPLGHGEKSLAIVLRFIHLTDEECLMIRWHMGSMPSMERQALKSAQDLYPNYRSS